MPRAASQRVGAASPLRDANLAAAQWVGDFVGPAYGPGGRAKLVQHGDAWGWWRSGASALREAPTTEPGLAPYRDLAAQVQRHGGDGATGAVLLAAGLVARCLDGMASGHPAAAYLDGLRLARRQAHAALAAQRVAQRGDEALASTVPAGAAWSGPIMRGLRKAASRGAIDLDRIDIRVEPDAEVAWADGLRLEVADDPRPGRTGVVILSTSWSVRPKGDAVFVRRGGFDGRRDEEALRRRVVDHLVRVGVGVVLVQGTLDEELRGALAARGITVWTDAPRAVAARFAQATGARPVARPEDAEPADVGHGEVERREHRWYLRGDGPSWTIVVPAQRGIGAEAARDEAERLLRAAGRVLDDGAALRGGGAWQRDVAAALRRAADAAPGKAALGVRAAADALAALAETLVRNTGRDAWTVQVLDGAWDAAACVDLAVDAAFDCAQAVLRLDARYDKRPSSTRTLRGSARRPGSPKGMPGDVPPLM